jgi:hypothetical protein
MNVLRRTRRFAPFAAAAMLLSACGGATLMTGTSVEGAPPLSTATHASPATLTPSPSPPPSTPAASAPVHVVTASTPFTIRPLFPGGAAGTVTVTTSATGVHFHIEVTHLVAGSVHAIHDHRGICGAANRSGHLSVLAVLTAGPAGVIAFDATVPAFQSGVGRIVIVYDSALPVLITGCAAL